MGHFGEESFQSIIYTQYTGTDNQTRSTERHNTNTLNKMTQKVAPENSTKCPHKKVREDRRSLV